ncbi:hypothetical protein D3C84_556520 [compost metagenome]
MIHQLLKEIEYFRVLKHLHFVQQNGKRQGTGSDEFEKSQCRRLSTDGVGIHRLWQDLSQAIAQQADKALQVVVGKFKVDPQHVHAFSQATLAILLHQCRFAKARGRADQDQSCRVRLCHLLQQACTQQMTVSRFWTGKFGGGRASGRDVLCGECSGTVQGLDCGHIRRDIPLNWHKKTPLMSPSSLADDWVD